MFLSFKFGLSFVSAAIACAMREKIFTLDPSSVIIAPKLAHSF